MGQGVRMSLISNIIVLGAGIAALSYFTGRGFSLPNIVANRELKTFELNPAISQGLESLKAAPNIISSAQSVAAQAANIANQAANEVDKLRGWAQRVSQGY